jgi:hypothetical protein
MHGVLGRHGLVSRRPAGRAVPSYNTWGQHPCGRWQARMACHTASLCGRAPPPCARAKEARGPVVWVTRGGRQSVCVSHLEIYPVTQKQNLKSKLPSVFSGSSYNRTSSYYRTYSTTDHQVATESTIENSPSYSYSW